MFKWLRERSKEHVVGPMGFTQEFGEGDLKRVTDNVPHLVLGFCRSFCSNFLAIILKCVHIRGPEFAHN